MLNPVHPGEVLKEEFMEPLGMSANALARAIGVPANRVAAIINGTRGVSADTALRLSEVFGTTPNFWLNLQNSYDLDVARSQLSPDEEIVAHDSQEFLRVHLIKLVRNVFGDAPDLKVIGRGNDLRVRIDWKLSSDPDRPNKRSRAIEVQFTSEFLEDYQDASERARNLTDENIQSHLMAKARTFVPEHDVPRHMLQPAKTWPIDSGLIRYP